MEGRIWSLGALLMIGLLFCCVDAEDPVGNVNLTPFEKWISAYECLQNTSLACPGNFQLTEHGNMSISSSETTNYCNSGCASHTRTVLQCLFYVKQDYVFMNKATIHDINSTISEGCKNGIPGFTGSTLIASNAGKAYESKGTAIIFATVAWSFFTLMSI
ncbi:hypothetical protein H6P81_014607 [Aristolochia fimbriata]|uniref:DUF7731 domain-containing protein n=1 Tax=Aristolochia fimbriata TaxID=158543 RepID=A0AAV7E617_ARIFI|nr:hypothetical protein H6P81_014607 [Aristolochia fimbriata]